MIIIFTKMNQNINYIIFYNHIQLGVTLVQNVIITITIIYQF